MYLWKKIVCGALCLTLLSGCASYTHGKVEEDVEPNADKVHLTMFGFRVGTTEIKAIEQVIEDFMEQNPDITITYEGLANRDGYLDVLYNRLEVGEAEDIFMLNPNAFAEVDRRGYIGSKIYDLSSIENLSNYNDTILQLIDTNGQVPGVPMTMGSYGMFVNVDKLEEYGLSVPTTLDEFLHCCRVIRDAGETPIAASLKDNAYAAKILALGRFLAVHELENGQSIDYDAYNSGSRSLGEDLREGFQLVKDICDEGYWDTEVALDIPSWTTEVEDFAEGSSAFLPGATWSLRQIWEVAPAFRYELTGLPLGDQGDLAMIKASMPICINAQSEHLEEALRFIDFITKPEVVDVFTSLGVALSPMKDGNSTVEDLDNIAKTVSEGRAPSPSDPRLRLDLETAVGKLCHELVRGTITVDEAVVRIDQELLGEE